MKIDKACYERGCACHDDRVDGETVEVVQRTWVGLTDEEVGNLSDFAYANDEEFVRNVEKHLKDKNSG